MASIRATFLLNTLWLLLAALAGLALTLAGIFLYLDPQIPTAESYREVRLETPLRIYSRDGALMGEFGERRVIPVTIDKVPKQFVQALLDTEDKRFYEHKGIDYISLANDSIDLLLNREIRSGASTITMQVSRNISFSLEQTFIRKFKEMLLALKIERELSKDEILELYINAVPFGKRAYGAQAAAYTYYGKPLHKLRLAQLAMLAGVPQAPSKGNPVNGPKRALKRRNLVLARMFEQGSISEQAYASAKAEPISARLHERELEAPAAFASEWVRQQLRRYPDLYTAGYRVYTTVERDKQLAATAALRDGLEAYDQKHGYRGPEATLLPEEYRKQLSKTKVVGTLQAAVVLAVDPQQATLLLDKGQQISIGMAQLEWARPYDSVNVRGPKPTQPSDVLAVGDLVRVEPAYAGQLSEDEQEAVTNGLITSLATPTAEVTDHGQEQAQDAEEDDSTNAEQPLFWRFSQIPGAQGALVSLDPNNGAVLAIEGGYDFALSQFNHALQATRQPGSGFKPFVYSAALANNVTPASIFMDAPLVFEDDALETEYRPDNDNNRYNGPTRLRVALYRSINLVSMRVMLKVGAAKVLEHVEKFGFASGNFPRDTQLAIGGGTMAVTPLQMAKAFGIFANSGFDIAPYIIERVENISGEVLEQANPQVVCAECLAAIAEAQALAAENGAVPTLPDSGSNDPAQAADSADGVESEAPAAPEPRYAPRVLDERNAYVVNSMLQDVIKRGTGRRALKLEREDIAGKTGTTNDGTDTWFNGYNSNNVTTVWVGFSNYDPLGARAYGGNTALPIWVDYMSKALTDDEPVYRPQPDGVVVVKIDPESGQAAAPRQRKAIFEYFFSENAPQIRATTRLPVGLEDEDEISAVELF